MPLLLFLTICCTTTHFARPQLAGMAELMQRSPPPVAAVLLSNLCMYREEDELIDAMGVTSA